MKDIELTDRNVTLLPDDRVTMGWAIKQGKDWGPYIFCSNRTTGETTFFTEIIRDFVKPSGWLFIPLWIVLSVLMLIPVIRGVSSDGITFDSQTTLVLSVLLVALPFVLAIVFFSVRRWIASRRADRIVNQLNEQFLPNVPAG